MLTNQLQSSWLVAIFMYFMMKLWQICDDFMMIYEIMILFSKIGPQIANEF